MNIKLSGIEIKNFLSYKDAKFEDFKDYNVIIGKNSSGKSNLFKIFKILQDSYSERKVNREQYYDGDETLPLELNLIFSLTSEFRNKIILELITRNFLNRVFDYTRKNDPKFQEFNWNDTKVALDWLKSNEYFNKIKIFLKKYDIGKALYIERIQILHMDNNYQDLFHFKRLDNDNFQNSVYNPKAIQKQNVSIDRVFLKNYFANIRTGGIRYIKQILEEHLNLENYPPIPFIAKELIKFFENIHIIPDKRRFNPRAETSGATRLSLDPVGSNLVTIIYKKLVTNEHDWNSKLNKQLLEFIPEIDILRQEVIENDYTILILKENDLNIELNLDNMGAGILNIAHFIAYIMEIGQDNILCIEEPGLHLHPGLEIKLRDKFLQESKSNQIFITTHSREFLYENEEECSVYLIQKENTKSIVNKILEEDFEEIYEELDLDINKYRLQQTFLYNEEALILFIKKAIEPNRIENDLWDFKQTLDFWEKSSKSEKKRAKIKFCNQVTSFANYDGGLLIIGITDDDPKKIVGIDGLEEKIKQIKKVLRKFTEPKKDFIKCKEIKLIDDFDIEKIILIVAIKQTREPILVEQEDGKFVCKKRNNTEAETVTYKEVETLKTNITSDNFNFFIDLQTFIKDNK